MGKGTLAIRIAQWMYNSDVYKLEQIVPVVPEPTWTHSFTNWATKKAYQ